MLLSSAVTFTWALWLKQFIQGSHRSVEGKTFWTAVDPLLAVPVWERSDEIILTVSVRTLNNFSIDPTGSSSDPKMMPGN